MGDLICLLAIVRTLKLFEILNVDTFDLLAQNLIKIISFKNIIE